MIVYGTKATQIGKELIVDKCPSCSTQNSVELYVFQKYLHIFWIPFVPISKTAVSQCGHCKQTLKLKEMPQPLKDAYQRVKEQSKAPIWTFSGLALLVILIVVGIMSSRSTDAKNAKLVDAPQQGDVYRIKNPDNQYTLYKVAEVSSDSVFVYPNQYETNKVSGISDIVAKGEAGYSDEMIPFSRAELKAMFKKGEIDNVSRK